MTLTFQVEASEDMKAFFDRMQKEFKEKEEAYKERIRQLFNEHINNCIRNGKMDALDSVLDMVFGKNENLNISVGSFESFLKELPDNPEDLDK